MIENNILKLINVSKLYNQKSNATTALDSVSFTIPRNDFCAIMGGSGSGKSTLLNLIATVDDVTYGKIYLDGIDISTLRECEKAKIRSQKIGMIFQDYNLLNSLTLYENILLAQVFQKKNYEELKRTIYSLGDRLGIKQCLKKYPYEVSGGEQQRCACLRALVKQPSILLADEPTGALDTRSSKELMRFFQQLNTEFSVTILLVTHSPIVASYAKHVYIMKDGNIINNILPNQKMRKDFLKQIIDFWGEDEAE